MKIEEIFSTIIRNNHTKTKSIELISDFMAISREEATKIYEERFKNETRKI
jgi:hypothetical protein